MITTLQSYKITHEGKWKNFLLHFHSCSVFFFAYSFYTESNKRYRKKDNRRKKKKSSLTIFVMSSIKYIERYHFILFSSIDMFGTKLYTFFSYLSEPDFYELDLCLMWKMFVFRYKAICKRRTLLFCEVFENITTIFHKIKRRSILLKRKL